MKSSAELELRIPVDPAAAAKWDADPEYREKIRRARGGLAHISSTKPPPRPPRSQLTADSVPCIYRGGIVDTVQCRPCRNAGHRTVAVYACEIAVKCVVSAAVGDPNIVCCATCTSRSIPEGADSILPVPTKRERSWQRAFVPAPGLPRYVTLADLTTDADRIVGVLPPGITEVLGVSRSGVTPAAIIAKRLHVPLGIVRHRMGDVIPADHGWRLSTSSADADGTVLVVDDTTMTGNSLKRTKAIVAKSEYANRPLIYVAVYVNPAATAKPDLWSRDLGWPHLLDWNLYNSPLSRSFALDFDGVLCRDARLDEDDDGDSYRHFLNTAEPLHLPRRSPVPLIVTCRLEKYRTETVAWLDRWGVRCDELVMHPARTLQERRGADIAAWKADRVGRFLAEKGGLPPRMFVESDRRQAMRISQLVDGLIVCNTTGECFRRDANA